MLVIICNELFVVVVTLVAFLYGILISYYRIIKSQNANQILHLALFYIRRSRCKWRGAGGEDGAGLPKFNLDDWGNFLNILKDVRRYLCESYMYDTVVNYKTNTYKNDDDGAVVLG